MAEKRISSTLWKMAVWLVVLAAVAVPVTYYLFREPEFAVTAFTVHQGPVESTVAAISSGTVMPARKSMVAAGMLGTIAALHVKEGDRVEADALLVELAHTDLDAQVALAEANLKVGESRLEQVRIGAKIARDVAATRLSQAAAQFDQTQADYNRIKTLSDQKAVSASDLEKVALAVRVAREAKAAAEAGVQEDQVRQEEIRSAEAALEQLRAAIQAASALRDKAFVRAPFAGVVAKKVLDVGEAVAMGMPLLQLVNDEGCYIEAPFDEANAAQVALGQKVRIEVDAYPEVEFSGEVTEIAPVVSFNQDLSRTLNVKVQVAENKEKLLPGMSADVTIIAEKKPEALFVPTESLIRDQFAYLVQGGRAVRRDVQTGIGNWETREILEGLAEGDVIVTSVSIKGLENGSRVRVVDELDE
jgi:HlyD family secretion protein